MLDKPVAVHEECCFNQCYDMVFDLRLNIATDIH